MQELERPLPNDALMERAILGAILVGHKQASEVLDVLKPEDFFDDRHCKIASTMLELYTHGTAVDLLSVHDELTRKGLCEAAGGTPYISSLSDGVASAGDVL